jgi:hypothetical protein
VYLPPLPSLCLQNNSNVLSGKVRPSVRYDGHNFRRGPSIIRKENLIKLVKRGDQAIRDDRRIEEKRMRRQKILEKRRNKLQSICNQACAEVKKAVCKEVKKLIKKGKFVSMTDLQILPKGIEIESAGLICEETVDKLRDFKIVLAY